MNKRSMRERRIERKREEKTRKIYKERGWEEEDAEKWEREIGKKMGTGKQREIKKVK